MQRTSPQLPSNTGLRLAAKASKARRKSCGRHADRLGLRLGFDHLVDAHRPFLVQHGLGHAMREPRAVGQRTRELDGFVLQIGAGMQRRCRSPRRWPSAAVIERPV